MACNHFDLGAWFFCANGMETWEMHLLPFRFISLPFGQHTCVKPNQFSWLCSFYLFFFFYDFPLAFPVICFPLTLSVWFLLTLGCLHLKSHHWRLSFAAFCLAFCVAATLTRARIGKCVFFPFSVFFSVWFFVAFFFFFFLFCIVSAEGQASLSCLQAYGSHKRQLVYGVSFWFLIMWAT